MRAILSLLLLTTVSMAAFAEDPHLWLEDIDGAEALEWVEQRNAESTAELEKFPGFAEIQKSIAEVLVSPQRIPWVEFLGPFVYNLWTDADNPRGLWRRTTLESYRSAEPKWELVLDIDALGEAEGESWVWKGVSCLAPEHRRCMVSLSRGGADAVVQREFDAFAKRFVPGGFELPEAKSWVQWKDENTMWLGTDTGEGSLTSSGYPRVARLWSRGQEPGEAQIVFEGRDTDVGVYGYTERSGGTSVDLIQVTPEFFRGDFYLVLDKRVVHLALPEDAALETIFKNQLLIKLRSDWTPGDVTYPGDGLISIDLDDFLAGSRDFELLFEPFERVALQRIGRSGNTIATTSNMVLLNLLDTVRSRIRSLTFDVETGWSSVDVTLPGEQGSAGIRAVSEDTDEFLLSYTDFLRPTSQWFGDGKAELVELRSQPAMFDAEGMNVEQRWAESADGTEVPYFIVTGKGHQADGKNPTLLYGYGGFEVSMRPRYSASVGRVWLERGGVYVVANIRGGGEFGSDWHQAARKENKQKSYDDFIAVAEDLIADEVTTPEHLGIMGGSGGGLLVGNVFVQRPELFDAVVCQVPLLDMQRYHKLLAGASWMAEYGDPDDPEQWKFIEGFSPYHQLKGDAEYPKVFLRTSTKDDRVHPGHARKMVAKMKEQGHPVLYWENMEGGHAGAADSFQRAYASALDWAYLWSRLSRSWTPGDSTW